MALRIAIMGTGYIAHTHARAIRNTPGAELVAVANHRAESLAAFAEEFAVARRYADVRSLLAAGGLDALVICTPNYLHAPQAIAALEAGVHVMVEKPMAMSVAEAEQMCQAAARSGARLMVAHCWRFDPEVRWLRQQVVAGRLGPIVRTKSYGVHAMWGPAGWFTQRPLAGGGALVDMGVHAIDTTRYLLGDPQPRSVYAALSTRYGAYDVDDTGMLLITWENGIVSYVESGWWQPHADAPEAGTQLYGRLGFGQTFPTRLVVAGEGGRAEVDPGFPFPRVEHCPQSMYDAQMQHFVESIRAGADPVPGGAHGLAVMRVVEAAYRSAATGKVEEI